VQIQEWWAKLNANEKIVGYGAIISIISWLVGLVTGGISYGFITAIIVLVVYWLKYSSPNMTWPAPVATIVLVVTAIAALFGLLGLLSIFGFLAIFYGGAYVIALLGSLVGSLVMVWGAWKEYQAQPKKA